jgi:hypothetical protein
MPKTAERLEVKLRATAAFDITYSMIRLAPVKYAANSPAEDGSSPLLQTIVAQDKLSKSQLKNGTSQIQETEQFPDADKQFAFEYRRSIARIGAAAFLSVKD